MGILTSPIPGRTASRRRATARTNQRSSAAGPSGRHDVAAHCTVVSSSTAGRSVGRPPSCQPIVCRAGRMCGSAQKKASHRSGQASQPAHSRTRTHTSRGDSITDSARGAESHGQIDRGGHFFEEASSRGFLPAVHPQVGGPAQPDVRQRTEENESPQWPGRQASAVENAHPQELR